jgi:hypothetical protein
VELGLSWPVLVLITGCAGRGPLVSGPVALEAETVATGGRVKAPAPPASCQAYYEVRAPLTWCDRAAATADGAVVPNRFMTYPGVARPYDGTTAMIECALECAPGLAHSRIIIWDREPLFRGQLLCELGAPGTFWVAIDEHPPLDVSTAVGAQWRTNLDSLSTVSRRGDGTSSPTRHLSGDNLCPDGQPTRTGNAP